MGGILLNSAMPFCTCTTRQQSVGYWEKYIDCAQANRTCVHLRLPSTFTEVHQKLANTTYASATSYTNLEITQCPASDFTYLNLLVTSTTTALRTKGYTHRHLH
jgi:hypothetical protein